MSVDRQQRDLLLTAIDRYLNEELTAFAFHDAIFEISDGTDDETVKQIIDELYCFYDDFVDHKVVLNLITWNYIQRLRLLLKSDAELELSQKRVWSSAQFVAAVGIIGFLWVAYWIGLGQQLFVVAIPFGVLSIALSEWRTVLFRTYSDWDMSLTPFDSVTQLLGMRRRVPNFRKQHYPAHLASRRIRGANDELLNALMMYPAWLIFAPFVLVAQLLPISVEVHKVAH